MSKVMVLGDMHGFTGSAIAALDHSKHIDYTNIVQVGDFGLWDHTKNGVKYLDDLNEHLRLLGRKLYAVGGNHENWDHWNWYIENMPKTADGFSIVRTHIMLAPRVHYWMWDKKRFYSVAGAASIDKEYRLDAMRNGAEQCWWMQEEITDEEVDGIPETHRDYLFTHDCSNRTSFGFPIMDHLGSYIHRQRIDRVLEKTTPDMHFHGHMHHKYDWMNRVSGDHWTQTYGLDCNGSPNAWGILDTSDNSFKFHPYK